MGDLKLFAKNDQQFQDLLNIAKQFSDDIRMEFGLDKCVKASFFCGKLLKAKNITLDTATVIKDLEPEESYKYARNRINAINSLAPSVSHVASL